MKLKYETGIATLVQFIVVSLLALINQIVAVIFSCFHNGSECIADIIPSVGYFILTAILFAFIWMLGYTAQERRTKGFAISLIFLELVVARVAYHNAKHFTDALGLITSCVNIALALWVILLAIRLFRSKGGRVVSRPRRSRARQ